MSVPVFGNSCSDKLHVFSVVSYYRPVRWFDSNVGCGFELLCDSDDICKFHHFIVAPNRDIAKRNAFELVLEDVHDLYDNDASAVIYLQRCKLADG
jgi:hypothetical protein